MTFDNPNAFASNLLGRLETLERDCFLATTSSQRVMENRIFEKGLQTDGTNIGNYSTTPRFVKSPNKTQSGFYEGGYAEFKKRRSKSDAAQAGRVDLRLSGELRINFLRSPRKIDDCLYEILIDGKAGKKAGWNEERYGDIFSISKNEQENYFNEMKNAVQKLLD